MVRRCTTRAKKVQGQGNVDFAKVQGMVEKKFDTDRPSSAAVIVLTTYPVDGDATGLATTLVQEELVACVNVLPAMQSIYRWQGVVEQAAEHQLIMKTTQDAVARLKTRLAELHPYEVPELLVLPISDGAAAYLAWLHASVRANTEERKG
jgi:periplasmic divalent cation tolerance protein